MAKTTRRAPLRAVDGMLEPAVAETVEALHVAPADAATAQLALLVARTIDGMDADDRTRLLPQHAGQLMRVLEALQKRAGDAASRPTRVQRLREARVVG
jgi:hypothetical protein